MDVVRCVGAALKAGHHRSAHVVLSAISVHAERQDQGLAAASRRALRDAKRSCFTGMGPLHQRRGSRSSYSNVYHGPQTHCTLEGHWYQDGALIAGAWWLPREVELATARTALIRFRKGPLGLEATWWLPASKTDPPLWRPCAPVDASARRAHWQRHARRARGPAGRPQELGFPSGIFSEEILCWDLPLFPTSSGEPCTKLGITATIEAAAVQVGQPLRSLWIGHSLRVGSVFSGSRSGHMDNPARWLLGVRSCLGYVRDAPLAMSRTWATRASSGPRWECSLARWCHPSREMSWMKASWASLKKELQHEMVKLKGSGTSTTSDAPRGEEGTFWLNIESDVAHGQRCILDEGPPRLFRASFS